MRMDVAGHALDAKQPSAEAELHCQLYRHFPDVGAVLHPHMMSAIVLARRSDEDVYLQNYELLKALDGISSHTARVFIPVFANDQDIPRLAGKVQSYLENNNPAYAYIIDGHGLYTWGRSMADTLRHIEALDYMFTAELQLAH